MEWNRFQVPGTSKPQSGVSALYHNARSLYDDKALLKELGYLLVKKIGHGSFSKVWRAYKESDHQDRAIKIIHRRKASKEFVEKFLPRELTVIQRLKHPHLLKYYEITESPASVYIIMEFAENGTLADLIQKEKRLPEDLAKIFFLQLVDVVEFIHKHGVVHRDIKCENLLLDRNFKLMLTDFGFAKSGVLPGRDGRIERARTYCGSYAYASPEILENKPYHPFLADVWCMGMVLYSMVVGALPFKESDLKMIIAAKKKPPKFPHNPPTTPETRNFIRRMLTTEENRASIPQLQRDPWLTAPITDMRPTLEIIQASYSNPIPQVKNVAPVENSRSTDAENIAATQKQRGVVRVSKRGEKIIVQDSLDFEDFGPTK